MISDHGHTHELSHKVTGSVLERVHEATDMVDYVFEASTMSRYSHLP